MISIPEFGIGSVVYLGVFLGVLLIFEGLWQAVFRGEAPTEARNRRLRLIAGGASTEQVLQILKPKEAKWSFRRLPLIGNLPSDMRRAGFLMKPGQFLALCAGVTLILCLVLATKLNPAVSLVIGLLIGLVLPVIVVRKMRDKRLKLLVSQLPDALDLMSRGLRVGHPLNATIAAVARDMIDPVATEFGIMEDQISYGDDLVSAFRDFAERVGMEDVSYLATGVAIQNGTGGDLARILATLAKVIRGRITMRKRILAISSEGRMTAVFMSLLPVFIFGMTSITSPTYYMGVSDDPMFRPIAITVVVLVVGNYLAMRRLVAFRI
ncbi:MAG: type II secretion system F family protein [Cypionkella sp.]